MLVTSQTASERERTIYCFFIFLLKYWRLYTRVIYSLAERRHGDRERERSKTFFFGFGFGFGFGFDFQ